MRLAGAVVCGLLAACGRAAGRGAACAVVGGGWLGVPVLAQGVGQAASGPVSAAPGDPSGRDFAGVRLRVPTVAGVVRFHASEATVWSEAGAVPVRRMLLEDHVVVELGDSAFEAKRAVVWLQSLRTIGTSGGEYQVYVVFEDVGSPTAAAGPGVAAHWLAVQGIIQTTGRPELAADQVLQGRPTAEIVERAEGELAAHLRREMGLPEIAGLAPTIAEDPRIWRSVAPAFPLAQAWPGGEVAGNAAGGVSPAPLPRVEPAPGRVAVEAGVPAGEVAGGLGAERAITDADAAAATQRFREAIGSLPRAQVSAPIPPARGVVTIDRTDSAVVQAGDDESTVIIDGGVVVQSSDARTGRSLLLKSQRAVMFLDPGDIPDLARFDKDRVRGVYLEGGVMVTDGQYTLQGSSVYYDLRADRAIVLDAVFNTYEARLRMPLYMRADAIRQEAVGEFTAERPRLAASAFNRPLLTLGASTVTLRRIGSPEGGTRNLVEADNITLRAASVPFFYWPTFEGDPERIPLRGVGMSGLGSSDGALRTTWDLLSLTGIDGPRDLGTQLEANLLADWYFERGVAGGVEANWTTQRGEGSLLAYGIFNDVGEDRTNGGAKIGRDGETRGLVLADQRWSLSDLWTIYGELSYIGDPTFVDAFFDRDGETRREFATGLTAQRLESNTAVTITGRGSLNDFSANEYIQAGPGYTTEKLPEFRYVRLSDDLLPNVRPGLLSYSLDARAGYNRLNFTEPTAGELGYRVSSRSQAAFGIDPDESIADRLRSEGYFEDGVWRLDARHELDGKFALGPVNITPFLVGRTTLYDNDFGEFSPEEHDNLRLWGMVGVTASTTIQRVDNTAESRLFDVNRLRHIVEPSATILHSASTVDSADLPIYDDDVEGLSEGTTARIGVNQTLQTERGGAGRWRSVDFFTLDAEVIINDDEREIETLVPRFYEPRPELSDPGTFGRIASTWQATESLGLSTDWVYSFDSNQPARISAGYLIQHSPSLTSSGEIRFLNPQDVTYFDLAAQYALTDKYSISTTLSWDVDRGDLRRARVGFRREFPAFYLRLDLTYDNVRDETSFGFTFLPIGTPALGRDLE